MYKILLCKPMFLYMNSIFIEEFEIYISPSVVVDIKFVYVIGLSYIGFIGSSFSY